MVKQKVNNPSNDTAENEHNESAVADALGISAISPSEAERYRMLRQQSAENMLSLLAARDEEYSRRQGARNIQFIIDASSQLPFLPKTTYTHDHDSHYPLLSTRLRHIDKLSNVSHTFVLSGTNEYTKNGLEGISGERLTDLSCIRATCIWIPLPTDQSLELPEKNSPDGRLGKNKFEQDRVYVPHIIVGHRLIENGKYTEVILMPLLDQTDDKVGYYTYSDVKKKRGLPFTAKMTTEAFHRLQAIQDTLIGEGLSPEEIRGIHDSKDGSSKINPSTVSCVLATLRRSAIGMAMSRMPEDEGDLQEDFDLMQTDTVLERIHPDEFTRYNVLAAVHRVFAMLGCLDKFESLKSELVQTSLEDPALKLIES